MTSGPNDDRHKGRKKKKKRKPPPPLTLEERHGQDLISFNDLRLFGIYYSRQHIHRLIAQGKFPRIVHIGGGARAAFVTNEIKKWIKGHIAARDRAA